MTTTPELDRAIVETRRKLKWVTEGVTTEIERTYARALVAELLRGMDGSDLNAISPAMVYGFNAALDEIKRRAGLEGEG